MAGAAVLCLFALLAGIVLPASEAMSGAITIAGYGPELREIERLTRACEEAHLGVVTEIRWDCSLHLELETAVKDGRYRLRCPVLLLRKPGSNPLADSFAEFALSKEGQGIVEGMCVPYSVPGM